MPQEIDAGDAQSAVEGIRSQGRDRVVTFTGFSGTGYEDEASVREVILKELESFDPGDTLVCRRHPRWHRHGLSDALKGFRTTGIVSSLRARRCSFFHGMRVVLVVNDPTWAESGTPLSAPRHGGPLSDDRHRRWRLPDGSRRCARRARPCASMGRDEPGWRRNPPAGATTQGLGRELAITVPDRDGKNQVSTPSSLCRTGEKPSVE
jgi:hypothetical protein